MTNYFLELNNYLFMLTNIMCVIHGTIQTRSTRHLSLNVDYCTDVLQNKGPLRSSGRGVTSALLSKLMWSILGWDHPWQTNKPTQVERELGGRWTRSHWADRDTNGVVGSAWFVASSIVRTGFIPPCWWLCTCFNSVYEPHYVLTGPLPYKWQGESVSVCLITPPVLLFLCLYMAAPQAAMPVWGKPDWLGPGIDWTDICFLPLSPSRKKNTQHKRQTIRLSAPLSQNSCLPRDRTWSTASLEGIISTQHIFWLWMGAGLRPELTVHLNTGTRMKVKATSCCLWHNDMRTSSIVRSAHNLRAVL